MIIHALYLDIEKIAERGNCFRMTRNEEGSYGLIHNGKYLKILPQTDKDAYEFVCDKDAYENVWRHYFDMDMDYESIETMVDTNDSYLCDAVRYGRGIRILNQDAWEMLISFIISQRKSIPAIRTSIEKLCKLCGTKIEGEHEDLYAFPTPNQVDALTEEEIASCSVGYRSKYIKAAAQAVVSGEINLEELKDCDDCELKENLLRIYGVGEKVAGCIMLFGYHRLDSFPVDVWIKRAVDEQYPNGFPYQKYSGYAGIMQQYIFFYIRHTYGRV